MVLSAPFHSIVLCASAVLLRRCCNTCRLIHTRPDTPLASTPEMDGAWSVVYLPRVLLDVVDQEWREDTLEDDGRTCVHRLQ